MSCRDEELVGNLKEIRREKKKESRSKVSHMGIEEYTDGFYNTDHSSHNVVSGHISNAISEGDENNFATCGLKIDTIHIREDNEIKTPDLVSCDGKYVFEVRSYANTNSGSSKREMTPYERIAQECKKTLLHANEKNWDYVDKHSGVNGFRIAVLVLSFPIIWEDTAIETILKNEDVKIEDYSNVDCLIVYTRASSSTCANYAESGERIVTQPFLRGSKLFLKYGDKNENALLSILKHCNEIGHL